jgi:site-specific DNA-methyltransferase (adenine-specific)
MPWRVAFALQADGWYLRQAVPWFKRSPMPESCTDRMTTAHEYVFLLTKRERYYYDGYAVRKGLAAPPHSPGNKAQVGEVKRNDFGTERMAATWGSAAGRNLRTTLNWISPLLSSESTRTHAPYS